MIQRTRGIVLHHIKYSDSSLIIKIYTEHFGLQSYIIKGILSAKSKQKAALFQPLSLLEIDCYHRPHASLQNIKEAKVAYIYKSAYSEMEKCSVMMFIAEILSKSLKHPDVDPVLFDFIFHALQSFDQASLPCSDFHLIFMVHLSKYLGFYPEAHPDENACFFDLRSGIFCYTYPDHQEYLSNPISKSLKHLLSQPLHTDYFHIPQNKNRKVLLNSLLQFYSIHIPEFKHIKSHLVLHELFH